MVSEARYGPVVAECVQQAPPPPPPEGGRGGGGEGALGRGRGGGGGRGEGGAGVGGWGEGGCKGAAAWLAEVSFRCRPPLTINFHSSPSPPAAEGGRRGRKVEFPRRRRDAGVRGDDGSGADLGRVIPRPGGLPLGRGRVVALISGGIDSPSRPG